MAILPLNEAAAGPAAINAATGGLGQFLQVLNSLNELAKTAKEIVSSPLLVNRFSGQGQGQILQQSPIIDMSPVQQQPQQQPAQLPAPAAAPAPALDEKKFIEMLMTPAGWAMMEKGLQQIKDLGGDMTISQMQDLLRSGKSLEQKPPENK